jgi:hypothetical protein
VYVGPTVALPLLFVWSLERVTEREGVAGCGWMTSAVGGNRELPMAELVRLVAEGKLRQVFGRPLGGGAGGIAGGQVTPTPPCG